MRVILAGSRSFGAAAYAMLLEEGHDVAAVLIDEVDGKLHRAVQTETPVWATDAPPVPWVEAVEADLFVAAHSHAFISSKARAATKLGGIGYHPSLLPRHRGRDAVRWTVHMGDAIAGGSVYWLTNNVDGGPIAAQDYCFVPYRRHIGPIRERVDDVASSLWRDELFPMGIRLLQQTLRDLQGGTIVEIPQDEQHATWEPSWERPPLFRPDLTQIGPGINGFQHVVTRER